MKSALTPGARPGADKLKSALVWGLAGSVSLLVLFLTWTQRDAISGRLPEILLLAGGAAIAARIASGGRQGPLALRLSLTFVLAAILLLPAPAALLVAMAGVLASAGAGVAGLSRRGVAGVAATLLGVTLARLFQSVGGFDPEPASAAGVANLLLLFILVQGFALALGIVLHEWLRSGLLDPGSLGLQGILIEAVNVPLAWLLAILLTGRGRLPSLVFVLVVSLAAHSLRRLDRALRDGHRTNDALAARVTELATLHAIGREILSSLDPQRIFSIVDRECRKIFPVDGIWIALFDGSSREMSVVYRRTRELADASAPAGEPTLARRAAADKQAVRIDDAGQDDDLDPGMRSALAVPLIVEDQVSGVIAIQSREPAAYDEHAAELLTTVAQQAAVAIENARHHEMATVDSLTGLYLREYFFRRVEEEYSRASRYRTQFALLMVDLDGFKEINDSHGHVVGDQYLTALGQTIRRRLRTADMACRYGGDELCLLLPETDLVGARTIAERIRSAVRELTVPVDGGGIRTTVSIGLAVFPEHDSGSLRTLLRRADEALYRAKRGGRDRVVPFAA